MGTSRAGAIAVALLVGAGGWMCWRFLHLGERFASGAHPAPATVPAAPVVDLAPPAPVGPPPEPTLAELGLTPSIRTLAPALEVAARACRTGVVMDLTNREILWQKGPDEAVEIASMTKMMTAYLLMRAIHIENRVTLADVVPVSRTAAAIGGSQVWIAEGERFTLEELGRCMMIQSANDTTHLIAEYLAGGSADAFVALMNDKALQLGLTHMKFYNAHGLPPDKQRKLPENEATALELAFLASRLLEFPDVIRWTSTRADKLVHQKGKNPETQFINHNSLVGVCPGVNGMKTGYTAKSMYCTTVTCTREGRTMIVVVTGCPRGRPYGALRDNLVRQFLDWAYTQNPAQAGAVAAPAGTRP
jgi:D-alanyl-D-alanine carboxypeptidase (penicillin-binding protein 5/6)